MIQTARGSFGLGPGNVEVGDTVVVFLGGRTPFIIREAEGSSWRFKGWGLVKGYMYGEAFEMEGAKEEDFSLT